LDEELLLGALRDGECVVVVFTSDRMYLQTSIGKFLRARVTILDEVTTDRTKWLHVRCESGNDLGFIKQRTKCLIEEPDFGIDFDEGEYKPFWTAILVLSLLFLPLLVIWMASRETWIPFANATHDHRPADSSISWGSS
jgi:hypothetical protein